MPDECWDIDQSAIRFRHQNFADLTTGRRARPRIIEHQLHVSEQDEVPVLMGLVQAPAFDETRSNREAVCEHQWIGVPPPAYIVDLDDAAALVRVCRCLSNGHALEEVLDRLALRRDGLSVA